MTTKIPLFDLSVEQPEYRLPSKAIRAVINAVTEDHLPIIEVFKSYEGEGLYIGEPRVLARVGGCLVGCLGCDTTNSWDLKTSEVLHVDTVVDRIHSVANNTVQTIAITGGEPSHYANQTAYVSKRLQSLGYKTWLETSGLLVDWHYFSYFDFISLDIKMPYSCAQPNASQIADIVDFSTATDQRHQVKAIVTDQSDLDWLEEYFHPLLVNKRQPLVLTPSAGKDFSVEKLQRINAMILNWLETRRYNVRVIAQQHVLLSYA